MTSLLKKSLVLALGAVLLFSGNAYAAIQGAADYRSSLVAGISASATTLTAVATSTPSGENLTQGAVYGLKLGGREYVLGTLGSGKQFTNLIRGVSLITGTTTGGVAEPWGRGTAIEITDAPVLLEIINKVSGRQVFDNVLKTSVDATTIGLDSTNLATVQYANNLSFGAIPAASETASGFVELSTQAEAAAGTSAGGTGARLVLGGNTATSTYNAATAAQRVIVSDGTGRIDEDWIPPTITNNHTFSGALTLSGTTNIGSTTIVTSFTPKLLASSTDGTGFTITNPGGTTYRYTYTGTGTSPGITALTVPTGSRVSIFSEAMSSGNRGTFTVTNSGADFFEVTNGSGVAEVNKTLAVNEDYFYILQTTSTWTKQTGLKEVTITQCGGGGGGGGNTTSDNGSAGGGGGSCTIKTLPASAFGATETVTIGAGGTPGLNTGGTGGTGGTTTFGSLVTTAGGTGGTLSVTGKGGSTTSGMINIRGGDGAKSLPVANSISGTGGWAFLGSGGQPVNDAAGNTSFGGFGGGGSGGYSDSGGDTYGGGGGPGVSIVQETYY